MMIRKLLPVLTMAVSVAAMPQAVAAELLVPAYAYPTPTSPFWAKLKAAAGNTKVTAIMNPNSGPGASVDPSYTAMALDFRKAGGALIGYVHTSYTNRPLADVKSDIDRYMAFYPMLSGFFLDEMSSAGTPGNIAYYQSLYSYVKSKNSGLRVVGNPGVTPDEAYLSTPTVDSLIVFEDMAANYAMYTPAPWQAGYPKSRFGHLVHGANSAQMADVMATLSAKGAGIIYVTDDAMPNPWDEIATYSDDEAGIARSLVGPSKYKFRIRVNR